MFELFFKVWWMIALLPFIITMEAWDRFSKFMDKGNHWPTVKEKWPYFLLAVFVLLLLFLLILGYR